MVKSAVRDQKAEDSRLRPRLRRATGGRKTEDWRRICRLVAPSCRAVIDEGGSSTQAEGGNDLNDFNEVICTGLTSGLAAFQRL